MKHYVPLPTDTGWAVAYRNHRGEFIAVMEANSLPVAYEEAARLTLQGYRDAQAVIEAVTVERDRYPRIWRQ